MVPPAKAARSPCLPRAFGGSGRGFLAVLFLAHASAFAETSSPTASKYDQVWHLADWYEAAANPVIQVFRFTGRFQFDYAVVDSQPGIHDEWNIRRFRLGSEMKLFRDFKVHGEVDLNPQEANPLYLRLTDLYVTWSPNRALHVTVGKHSAPFTLDGATSSKELLTVDRNNLSNNLWFPQEYFPGASVSGRTGDWHYWTGIYSSGAANSEFGEFNGGWFLLGSLGYDFGPKLGFKQALLSVNHVYNDPDRKNTFTRSLEHVGSLNFQLEQAKWGFRADCSGGIGYLGQSDLWGVVAMPCYNVTDKLQLVGRYTYLHSASPNGVRLNLYENVMVAGRGDDYHEFHFGLNYYFYEHKLKLQTGVQYAKMEDRAGDGGAYHGWAWTTGVRVSW